MPRALSMAAIVALYCVPYGVTGCTRSSEVTKDDAEVLDGTVDADATLDADAMLDAEDDADTGPPATTHSVVPCYDRVHRCGDGMDNDGDGLIDSDDPDCLGPCDNDEESYDPFHELGIRDGWWGCSLDCYFDADMGSGGGDCLWDVRCDPANPGGSGWGGPGCAYVEDHSTFDCAAHFDAQYDVRAGCQANCEFRTPNGCDCFGCCLFPTAADPNRYLLIGSLNLGRYECTYAEAIKEESPLCASCTPVPSCLVDCPRCGVCLGRRTVPGDCTPDEVANRCPPGAPACGLPGDEPCEPGSWCLTGCCVQFPVIGG